MRALHIVHQYPPDHVGGTEIYTQSLVRAQARQGHVPAVFVASEQSLGTPYDKSLEAGALVYRVPVGDRSSLEIFRSTFGHAQLASALETVMDDFRPDVVHIQHLMGLPARFKELLQARKLPVFIALHDYWWRCANAQLLTNYDGTLCDGPDAQAANCARCALARVGLNGARLAAPALAPAMRRRNQMLQAVFAGAAQVIAPNEFVRSVYARLGLPTEKVVVMPWGMDLPPDLPEIRAAAALERASRPPGTLRLGYVGSLSHQKGLHILVDAVNQLPHEGVTLDIYGNPDVFPDYVAELRQMAIHPGITFAGLLTRAQFWSRLAALDALILPTLWYEASPLTIDEAFAAGTPVVGSNLGALSAKIRDGQDGRLFLPGEPAALADLLRALLNEPDQLATLRAGIRPVKTMDAHAAEITGLYAHAVADQQA